MAASNTVEATLVSRLRDDLTPAAQRVVKSWQSAMNTMHNAGAGLTSFITNAWASMTGAMEAHGRSLLQRGSEAQGFWNKLGLVGAGAAMIVVGAFIQMGRAALDFIFTLAKETSETLELKLAFESLTQTMGISASVMQGELQRATEGLVSTSVLLRNANRVLSADIPLTADKYTQLVAAVFKLSKASGVDATQAINTLTDALIKGNARGFQAIGLNIGNVKDAISQMAEAMGQSTNKVENAAKLQTFYNELLQTATAAAARNGAEYFSLADAITKAGKTWDRFLEGIGEAIGRSRVFEELLKKLSGWLDKFNWSEESINSMALTVNNWTIGMLYTFGIVARTLAVFVVVWDATWGTVKAVFHAASGAVAFGLFTLQEAIAQFIELLTRIPGLAGTWMGSLAQDMRKLANSLRAQIVDDAKGLWHSFDGFGDNTSKLWALHNTFGALVIELGKFQGLVVKGEAGTRKLAKAGGDGAQDLKKLQEQISAYQDLWRELGRRMADERQGALMQYQEDISKILKMTDIGAGQRVLILLRAAEAYQTKIAQINQKEQDEALKHQALLAQIEKDAQERRADRWLKFWTDVYSAPIKAQIEAENKRRNEAEKAMQGVDAIESAVGLARQGKIGAGVGEAALAQADQIRKVIEDRLRELSARPQPDKDELNEIVRLQTQLEKLNRINLTPLQQQMLQLHESLILMNKVPMDPFHQALQGMQQHIFEFVGQAGEAFASFFADIVSGQEGAGKKLLAAFLGMIGQMLVKIGAMLIQIGVAEVAAASTMWGKLMGFSAAAGWKAIATGAVLSAVGGALMGASSALAQTNQAGAGGSFQQEVARPTANTQVPIYMVGAPRGAQTPGQAAIPQEILLKLKIEPSKDAVVTYAVEDIRNNGKLRVAVLNA